MTTDAPAYTSNAQFWLEVIRGRLDRYRTDLTDRVILEAVRPAAGEMIIDAGCGEGWLSRACAEAGAHVLGVDNCRPFIDAATAASNGTGPTYELADVRNIPVPGDHADAVVANHVLNDVPDPASAIKEFARVLRPGGRFVTLMLHPCFYGPQAERRVDAPQASATDYFASPRIVSQPFVIAGRTSPAPTVTHLWPLEYWFASLFAAGLSPVSVTEPRPGPELMTDPWWQQNFRRPLFLLIDARRSTDPADS